MCVLIFGPGCQWWTNNWQSLLTFGNTADGRWKQNKGTQTWSATPTTHHQPCEDGSNTSETRCRIWRFVLWDLWPIRSTAVAFFFHLHAESWQDKKTQIRQLNSASLVLIWDKQPFTKVTRKLTTWETVCMKMMPVISGNSNISRKLRPTLTSGTT